MEHPPLSLGRLTVVADRGSVRVSPMIIFSLTRQQEFTQHYFLNAAISQNPKVFPVASS